MAQVITVNPRNSKERRATVLNADKILYIDDGDDGATITLDSGDRMPVTQSAADVQLLITQATAAPGTFNASEIVRKDSAALRAINPVDRAPSFHPRPDRAPAWGEEHPSAHEAAAMRRQSGDPLINENVPRKSDEERYLDQLDEQETAARMQRPAHQMELAEDQAGDVGRLRREMEAKQDGDQAATRDKLIAERQAKTKQAAPTPSAPGLPNRGASPDHVVKAGDEAGDKAETHKADDKAAKDKAGHKAGK